ncbi:RNA recognition motif [Conglomerata obtusa]
MQLFLGGLKSLKEDELYDYFNKFGKITSLKVMEGYGFITFEDKEDAFKVLDEKHQVSGININVEESANKGEKRRDDYEDKRNDYDNRRGDFDSRRSFESRRKDYDDRGREPYKSDYDRKDYGRRDYDRREYDRRDYERESERRDFGRRDSDRKGYEKRDYDRDYDRGYDRRDHGRREYDEPRNYSPVKREYERSMRSPTRSSRRCDYCDRCPIHGTEKPTYDRNYDRRSDYDNHDGNKLKVVLMGISEETQVEDVREFARHNDLEPAFIKITFNKKFAIIRFNSFNEKEEALERLEKKELLGNIVQVRPYKTSQRDEERGKRFRRENDYDKKENDFNYEENNKEKKEFEKMEIDEQNEEGAEKTDDLYKNI